MNIALLGAPGAGKGTQAKMISSAYSLPHISTGDLFRADMSANTPLGELAKSYIDRGMLVPDDVTVSLVKSRLQQPDCKGGFILDGFPRTLPQADALSGFARLEAVINISVPRQFIMERMTGRRVCTGCGAPYHTATLEGSTSCKDCGGQLIRRSDDAPDVVSERLVVYDRQTAPLIDYYTKKGVLFTVHSDDIIDNTFAKIRAILDGNN